MIDDANDALGVPPAQPTSTANLFADRMAQRAGKLARRYKAGYDLANLLVRLGNAIKIIAFFLGALALLGGVVAAIAVSAENQADIGHFILISLLVPLYSAVIWFILFVYATVIAGIGQVLQAVCDGAIYNSPFLSDEDRAGMLLLDQ